MAISRPLLGPLRHGAAGRTALPGMRGGVRRRVGMAARAHGGLTWATLALLLAVSVPAWAEGRLALVIGNGAYTAVDRLANPAADARAVADRLRALGFEVTEGTDLTKAAMDQMIRRFGEQASQADVVAVFYAGHGIQVSGRNYLAPVDVKAPSREQDLRYDFVDVDAIMDAMAGARLLRIVMLDACRDNPLAAGLSRSLGRGLGTSRGLALPAGLDNVLIAYATAPDAVAADGAGAHSPFTQALLAHIEDPGLDVRLMFGRVRDDVRRATRNQQNPFVSVSMGGEGFAFNPAPAAPAQPGGAPPVAAAAGAAPPGPAPAGPALPSPARAGNAAAGPPVGTPPGAAAPAGPHLAELALAPRVQPPPVQLAPVQPAPVQPTAVQPAPVQPAPIQPMPLQPAPPYAQQPYAQQPVQPGPARFYAGENLEFGVPPQAMLRADVGTPTPLSIPGARAVSTMQLATEMRQGRRMVLVDALDNLHSQTIPGAAYLPAAGRFGTFSDKVQAVLARDLAVLTRGQRETPVVFFCRGVRCWESYNAALRAVMAGYPNVFWYRGGLESWMEAGLPMGPVGGR